jgi:selenocysteine-specific elongation factor
VRGIQGHGSQLDVAAPGGRTAVALAGIDVADVPRGSTIVTDREWHPTTFARADVTLVPDIDVDLRPRTWFRFHVGTAEVGARVVARAVDPSRPFAARIVLDAPVLLRAGDRFVLRTSAPLNTIGGGVITDPYAPKRARPWTPGMSATERLALLLDEAAGEGLELSSLPVRLGLSPSDCREMVRAADGAVSVVGARLVAQTKIQSLGNEILVAATQYQRDHPLDPGMPTQLLRARLRASPEVVEAAIRAAIAAGGIAAAGGLVSTVEWAPKLDSSDEVIAGTIVSRLTAAGSEPPSVDELSGEIGRDIASVLRFLERRGDVVQVELNRYYTTNSLKLIVDRLRTILSGGVELGPSELREKLGLSRKFLIPLLEYCDREGYTSRGAAGRVWHGT